MSFDLNYREKLWKARPAATRARCEMLERIVEHVDVLVGNEEDLQKGLGHPRAGGRRARRSSTRARSSA